MLLKTFRPYDTSQSFLLPPNPRDWLPPDHLAFFVEEVVGKLDLSRIAGEYDGPGGPPFNPAMMVSVLVYSYCRGVRSSRKIERLLQEDVSFRVLAANQQPGFRSLCEFRARHLAAVEDLFVQVLQLCEEAGLVKLGHVALDGTRIKANASKRKAMSLKGLKDEEQRLREEVRRMLREAEEVDAEEDARYGPNQRGDELPPGFETRQSRLRKIEEARKRLEDREREEIVKTPARQQRRSLRQPRDSAQWNFTDPDSGVMPDNANRGAFLQGYNAQLAVDAKAQVIVAYTVERTPVDNKCLEPVVERMEANLGRLPAEMSLDAGYNAERNLAYLEGKGVDAYVNMAKHKRDFVQDKAPRGRIPVGLSIAERMRRKVSTKRGKAKYGLRKVTVEPVFGQLKEARGFRTFMLRGREKVLGEWGLACLAHNMLKMFRANLAA